MYFVGFQDGDLVALDPHQCRVMEDPAVSVESYHCNAPRKVRFDDMDPSVAIGFLCRTEEELEGFYRVARRPPPSRRRAPPLSPDLTQASDPNANPKIGPVIQIAD